MTISYAGNFARLLLRWKGSIWKTVWKELLIFLLLYYCVRLVYRFALTEYQHRIFEYAILRFDEYTKYIPLTFLLGFYISTIVTRWWNQFELVAWPDDLLSLICAIIPGSDEESRLKRHITARYLNLTAALAWRDISVKVRKRFPTISHLVSVGLMTEEEQNLYHSVQAETVRWFLPLQWTQKIVQDVVSEGKIPPPLVTGFYSAMSEYRRSFRKLYCYDWVCIPLVYTQVAALATYGYFVFCLIGHQFLDMSGGSIRQDLDSLYRVDMVVPIYTILQFLFYVGWFKVGQDLMRPFGTDDDDIELNYILDRNVQASFNLVDQVSLQQPAITPDKFWQPNAGPSAAYCLPHTKISSKIKEHPPKLHAYFHLKNESDAEFLNTTQNLLSMKTERRLSEKESKKHWRQF